MKEQVAISSYIGIGGEGRGSRGIPLKELVVTL